MGHSRTSSKEGMRMVSGEGGVITGHTEEKYK